jgi:hypothetical protein
VARDAIARLYDVKKNTVKLICLTAAGNYRPGTITFVMKKGKSLNLAKLQASIKATRLSGGTAMGVNYLEITATGKVVVKGKETLFQVAGTNQQFVLGDDPTDKPKKGTPTAFQRLRAALAKGAKVTQVTGRIQGWSGTFPRVLRAVGRTLAQGKPMGLMIRDFRTSGEKRRPGKRGNK